MTGRTWPPGRPLERVDLIVIHHSATADSGTLSWGAIERHHVQVNGWDAVGYHAGAELVRDTYQVLLGRPTNRTGAHTAGVDPRDGVRWNHKSLALCFVGDYDQTEPPDALLEVAARRFLVPQLEAHGLGVEALVPHRDMASKSCPGERFDMDRLRAVCLETQRKG